MTSVPTLVAVCGERVLDARGRAVDQPVVLRGRRDPVAVDRAGRAEHRLQRGDRREDDVAVVGLVAGDADHAQRHRAAAGAQRGSGRRRRLPVVLAIVGPSTATFARARDLGVGVPAPAVDARVHQRPRRQAPGLRRRGPSSRTLLLHPRLRVAHARRWTAISRPASAPSGLLATAWIQTSKWLSSNQPPVGLAPRRRRARAARAASRPRTRPAARWRGCAACAGRARATRSARCAAGSARAAARRRGVPGRRRPTRTPAAPR